MEKNVGLTGSDRWGAFYQSGRGSVYPDENLVRLIKREGLGLPKGGKVLDVGFGTGNNLVMLAQLGYEAYGLEVSKDSIAFAREQADLAQVPVHLGLLTGTSLPFPAGYFDIVLSWNAVYYFGNRSLVAAALKDFHRVLNPQGSLLLSVIHPNCFLVRRFSNDLGEGRYRIEKESPIDNRCGLEVFYDPSSSGWRQLLADFRDIKEGYVESDLFLSERRAAWRLFLARKD